MNKALDVSPTPGAVRRNKYGAKKVEIGGIVFDSKAEARHFSELSIRLKAGEIRDLRVKPVYVLVPAVRLDGRVKAAAKYTPDFDYVDAAAGKLVVVDVKGAKSTEAFRLRKHLMAHVHGINVIEVRK